MSTWKFTGVLYPLPMTLLLLLACTDDGSLDTSVPEDTAGDTSTTTSDCSGGSGWATGGWILEGVSSAEYTETAFIYVPADLPACAPLVFFGHGGGNAGGYVNGAWMDPLGTGLPELADTWGFAFIAPGVAEGGSGDHLWGDEPEVLAHMDAMIEGAWGGLDLDRERLWFIGQSAGGHMAVYLGLYLAEPWTGIAVISAGLGGYFDYPEPEPALKVPFFVAHDPNDTVVDYSASEYLAEQLEAHGHAYTFDEWDLGGHGWNATLSQTILDWLNTQ